MSVSGATRRSQVHLRIFEGSLRKLFKEFQVDSAALQGATGGFRRVQAGLKGVSGGFRIITASLTVT